MAACDFPDAILCPPLCILRGREHLPAGHCLCCHALFTAALSKAPSLAANRSAAPAGAVSPDHAQGSGRQQQRPVLHCRWPQRPVIDSKMSLPHNTGPNLACNLSAQGTAQLTAVCAPAGSKRRGASSGSCSWPSWRCCCGGQWLRPLSGTGRRWLTSTSAEVRLMRRGACDPQQWAAQPVALRGPQCGSPQSGLIYLKTMVRDEAAYGMRQH